MENELIIKGIPYVIRDFLTATFQEIALNNEFSSGLKINHFAGTKSEYENNMQSIVGYLNINARLIYSVVRDSDGRDLFSFILRWLPSKETKISLIKLRDYAQTDAIWKELINQAHKLGFLDRMPFIENPDQPWNEIPDIGWDRQALKLWWEDLTAKKIGVKLQKSPHTILNKISELRRNHGKDIVPKRRSSKKFDKSI